MFIHKAAETGRVSVQEKKKKEKTANSKIEKLHKDLIMCVTIWSRECALY